MTGKENIMKKIRFAAVMALMVAVLLLPACGSTPKTDSSSGSSMSSGEVDGAGKDMADDAKSAGDDMKDAAGDMADGMKDAMTPDSTDDSTNAARGTAGTNR